jgi:hypothetical protein
MLAQFSWTAGAQAEATHTIIAASGAAAPAGGNYRAFLNVALNTRGQVAFDAFLGGPSTSGVFVNDGMTTSVIALGGDPDPAAGNFSFVFAPSITTRGDVIFDTFDAVFRSDGRTTLPLMQNGDAAPGGGNLILSSFHVANARGSIAYLATVTGGDSTLGIFRNDGSQTVAIARDNTLAPTGGTFLFFGEPVIDKHHHLCCQPERTRWGNVPRFQSSRYQQTWRGIRRRSPAERRLRFVPRRRHRCRCHRAFGG